MRIRQFLIAVLVGLGMMPLLHGQTSTFPTEPQKTVYLGPIATTTTSPWMNLTVPPDGDVHYFTLTWKAVGTVATCQIKVQQAISQAAPSDLIVDQDCTTDGTISTSVAAETNYVRINLDTKTGSGTTVAWLDGFRQNPSGTVTVSPSGGTMTVKGNLTNNNAAPTTNNVGVLPALANAAQPTYTEGDQVLASTNLKGATRIAIMDGNGLNNRAAAVDANGQLGVVAPGITAVVPTTSRTVLTNGQVGDFSITPDQALITANAPIASVMGTAPSAGTAGNTVPGLGTRTGIPFSLGGSPDVATIRANLTGANTDVALITVSSGSKIIVTQAELACAYSTSVAVSFVIGFGAANTPTTTGVVMADPGTQAAGHSGISRGNGSGILGTGADGEDLRYTNSVPTGGSCDIVVSYFTVAS